MVTLIRLGRTLRLLLLLAAGSAGAFAETATEPKRAANRVLIAGVETHALPFTGVDAQGQPVGFSVELLQAVARDQGLTIKFEALPWGELIAGFKTGRIDIICNVVDTPERHAFMAFSVTTALLRGGLFTREDQPPIRTLADVDGRRLAVPKDSRAHQYIQTHGWPVRLVFVSTLQEALDSVHTGHSDLFLATNLVTDDLIKRSGYRDIVASEIHLDDFNYREHFGVQLGQAELLASLNNGLLNTLQHGTYDRLYEKWIGPIQPRQLHFNDLQPYLLPLAVLVLIVALAFVWQRGVLAQVSRQAEALRLSEERLSLVFEGSQDGFWDWDVRSNTVSRSPRWAEMLGYTLEEIGPTRLDFLDLIHPDDRPTVKFDEKIIWQSRDHFTLEFRMKTKSGTWKWILDRGKVVARDPATHEPLRVAGTHTDITERKLAAEVNAHLQGKMLESEKLESLGVLAGGIAHDFNNLLTVILGNASVARLDSFDSPENLSRLERVTLSSKRAADLCRQLLAYAGKGSFSIERVSLNELVRNTASLLEHSISRQAKLEFTLNDAIPAVEADPSQLRQVLMNLVLNASEALGDKPGEIRLASQIKRIDSSGLPRGVPTSDLPPGDYVCLEVSDTGSGMSPAVIERIFDPFYTTKFAGRGLGLPAVLGIIRSHHGALTVASRPGMGTVIQILLPVAPHPSGLGSSALETPARDPSG